MVDAARQTCAFPPSEPLSSAQVVDAAISESVFNMLEGCVPEYVKFGYDRPPSGSTITGVAHPSTNPPLSSPPFGCDLTHLLL